MGQALKYYQERLAQLRTERESFIPHWRDLSEHISPRLSRFLIQDRNKGDKRNQKILNERATLALGTLSSGMMSGVTNPARPWAVLRTADPDLNKYKPVKVWLYTALTRMMELFLKSNVYTTLPLAYGDQGLQGISAYLVLDDLESLLRCYHYPVGSYMLAADHRGRIDTCYREFSMTARQMVQRFGKDKCSKSVQSMATQGAGKESWVEVVHAVEPNPDFEPSKAHFSYYKQFHSCYFEQGAPGDQKLREGGFDSFPVIAPRWDVTGEDVYGSSPGMKALGAVRQLQLREKRKGQLIDKGVSPPMKGPASLQNKRSSILSGDMTYVDTGAANQEKFEPVYQPNPAYYQWVLEDIHALENRISRIFFEDLFLMLANDTRSNITAREIAERHEEKLLLLGPVLLRQNDEHFDPLINIAFGFMAQAGILPQPVPPELKDMEIGVEYISILSQAMKLVGVASLERGMGFAGNAIGVWPEIRHSIDPYQAVSEYFSMIGAPPKVLRDRQEYDDAILGEKEQARAQQLAAAAPVAAETVKTLSDAKIDEGETALSRISEMLGAAA
jgi:hypothetical protein